MSNTDLTVNQVSYGILNPWKIDPVVKLKFGILTPRSIFQRFEIPYDTGVNLGAHIS